MSKLFLAIVFFNSNLALAQVQNVYPAGHPKLDVVTEADVVKAQSIEEEIDPMLYGGRRAADNELPPTVSIGGCTASIVGKNALLTAGHCRSGGSSIQFTYNKNRHSGRCTRHPNYSQGGWLNNDWTLCKFEPQLDIEVYADLSPVEVKVGDRLFMNGYGQGSNGYLNVGESVIYKIDEIDIVTRTRVSLGKGDSGGPLYLAEGGNLIKGPLIQVGVNSRGGGGNSYFNRAALDRSQKFFRDWANENSAPICGVTLDCGVGGSSKCAEETKMVTWQEVLLLGAKKNLEACGSRAKMSMDR